MEGALGIDESNPGTIQNIKSKHGKQKFYLLRISQHFYTMKNH